MKRTGKALALCLALLLVVLPLNVSADTDSKMVRVGLYYGSNALASANLENSVGSGYQFGYFDGSDFEVLGNTAETQISMLKTQNIYLKGGTYSASNPGSPDGVVGCYHIQLPGNYADFSAAKSAASSISGAFPAWILGKYVVRVGAYESNDAAESARSNLGLSDGVIAGTTSYGFTVTQTKTTKILFQFDNGGTNAFSVIPSGSKTVTWFKGYKYYGTFLYERISGGDITVSNYVSMGDYLKGVLPYEMSASWPLEALKAQAVCARNYTQIISKSKHQSQHFELCNTDCCQVYRGLNSASSSSDKAVDETAGVSAWYDGKLAETYYYSSNGGASEDVRNVWSSSSSLPYLCGVVDPYEATIESTIPSYRWTKTYTGDELATTLSGKGYPCNTIVDVKLSFTDMGNVNNITFTDSAGKTLSFSKERSRTILNFKSMRYQVSGGGAVQGAGQYYVDPGGGSIAKLSGVWTIGEKGETVKQSGAEGLFILTDTKTQALTAQSAPAVTPAGSFVFSGAGSGHNVGMSQWGAYAMAKQGKTYEDILKFYYIGIDLY